MKDFIYELSAYLYEKFKSILVTNQKSIEILSVDTLVTNYVYEDLPDEYEYNLQFKINQSPENMTLATKKLLDETCLEFTNYVNRNLIKCELMYEDGLYDEFDEPIDEESEEVCLLLETGFDGSYPDQSQKDEKSKQVIYVNTTYEYKLKSYSYINVDKIDTISFDERAHKKAKIKTNEYLEKLEKLYNLDLNYLKFDMKYNFDLSQFKSRLSQYKKLADICKDQFRVTHQSVAFAFIEDEIVIKIINECDEKVPQQTDFYNEIADLDMDFGIIISNQNPVNYLDLYDEKIFTFYPLLQEDKSNLSKAIILNFNEYIDWNQQEHYGRSHLVFRLDLGKIADYRLFNSNTGQINEIKFYNETNELIMSFEADDLKSILANPIHEFIDKINQLIEYYED